jgi:hypothetical protein
VVGYDKGQRNRWKEGALQPDGLRYAATEWRPFDEAFGSRCAPQCRFCFGNPIDRNYNVGGAGQTVAGSISCRLGGRKVRTPQGGVPRNAGGS